MHTLAGLQLSGVQLLGMAGLQLVVGPPVPRTRTRRAGVQLLGMVGLVGVQLLELVGVLGLLEVCVRVF